MEFDNVQNIVASLLLLPGRSKCEELILLLSHKNPIWKEILDSPKIL